MKIILSVRLEDVAEAIWDTCPDQAELKSFIESVDLRVADVDFTMELVRTLSQSLKNEMNAHSDEGLEKVQKKINKFITFMEKQFDA